MKAKDLAALAALGVAGYAAYDKFGSKAPVSQRQMGEGLNMTNQGAYALATRPESDAENVEMGTKGAYLPETPEYQTKGAYLPDTAELGTKGAYLDDTPEFRTRGAYLSDGAVAAAPSANSGFKKVKASSSGAAAQPAAVEAAPKIRSFTPPGAQDSMGAFTNAGQAAGQVAEQSSSPYSDVVSKGDLGSQDFRSNAKRLYDANEANGAANPASLLTDAYGNVSRAEQNLVNTKKRAEAAPLIAKSSALANESHAYQAAVMAKKRAAAQAAKMDEIARLTELNKANFAGGRRAKGGVVKKMASGGLASSKMSKPSGASRGDGIAQRGRTRGTLR